MSKKTEYEVRLTFGGTRNDGGRKFPLVRAATTVNGKPVSAVGHDAPMAISALQAGIADAELIEATKASLPQTVLVTI